MIPEKTIEELITRHSSLEKDLASGNVDKKLFAEKSKEYSREIRNFNNRRGLKLQVGVTVYEFTSYLLIKAYTFLHVLMLS